jgi:hypothetical protein
VLEVVLVSFVALNGYVVYQHGYIGFFDLVMANVATVAAMVDLSIALGIILVWMWQDAKERGVSIIPHILLTLTLGSVGPLVYLIQRAGSKKESLAYASGESLS